ncbi:MAG: hypothetical protein HY731_02955, partial [Candidatus Tectomicrobia bacterium]|nr:hypothetical protein [Candidatus Tectomicrobia bacterium]
MDELKRFIKGVLERSGGIVEEGAPEILEVILPRYRAEQLGVGEYVKIRLGQDGSTGDDLFVAYGSDLLHRLHDLIGQKGNVAACAVQTPYLKQEGFEKEIAERFRFTNGKVELITLARGFASYLRLIFRYAAISDEKQEHLIETIVNEASLATPSELLLRLQEAEITTEIPSSDEQIGRLSPAQVYQKACRVAKHLIEGDLREFQKSMERRLSRDLERIRDYYGTLVNEMRERIEKRRLRESELEEQLDRIRATWAELERKQ